MMKKKCKIVLTGPESTGKSTLCKLLAEHYHQNYTTEYAREYIENLNRDLIPDDIQLIHDIQIAREKLSFDQAKDFLFCDTDIFNFKIWLQLVYKLQPKWLDDSIIHNQYDFYLLCYPDIEWIPDGIRKNKDDRDFVYNLFLQELKNANVKFAIITGEDTQRLANSILAVDEFLLSI